MNAERKAVLLAISLGVLACLLHVLIHDYLTGGADAPVSLRELLWHRHDTELAYYNASIFIMFCLFGLVIARVLRERRQAQEQLRVSRRELEDIFETAAEALFVLSSQGQIIRMNAAAAELTGKTGAELVGQPCSASICSHHCETEDCTVYRALQGESIDNREVVVERAGGQQRVCLLTARPLWVEESGQGVLVGLRDITELREAEIQYSTIVETTVEGVMVMNFEGEIKYANDALKEILAPYGSELAGHKVEELLTADQLKVMRQQLQRRQRGESGQYELTYRLPDGREIPVMVSATPLRDATGQVIGSFAMLSDISYIKEVERRTIHLNSVLLAVRNINQLITREQDRDRLLHAACDSLVRTRGYDWAELVLLDDDDEPTAVYAAELETKPAERLALVWEKGWWRHLPREGREVRVIAESEFDQLPPGTEVSPVGVAVRLRYDDKHYGALLVMMSSAVVVSDDEKYLFEELASDLAFALYAMEMRQARERYQAELKGEKERSERIINTAGALIAGMDLTGTITLFNEQCEKTTGFRADQVIGRKLWDVLLPKRFIPAVKAVFDELTSLGQPNSFENAWLTADGSERLITWRNTPIADAKGEFAEIIAIGLDVTEHRAAELAIQESEQEHRLFFNSITDAVFVYELAADGMPGQFLAVNDSACETFGFSRQELLTMSPLDLDAPESRARTQSAMLELIDKKHLVFFHEHVTYDGCIIPSEVAVHLMQHEGQLAVLSISRDITERHQAQQALQNSETLLATSINALTEWIHVVDADFRVIMANQALQDVARQLQLPEFYPGIGLAEWFPFLSLERQAEYEQVWQTGESIIRTQRELVQGHTFVVETSKVPVFEADEVVRIVTTMRDITARVQAEEALGSLNRRYELLAESQAVGTFIWQNGEITFANRSLHEKMGYQPGELSHVNPIDFITASEKAKAIDKLQVLLETEGSPWLDFETQLVTKSGELLWGQVWIQSAGLVDGMPTVIGHIVDITETRELRSQLEHSHRLESLGTLAGGMAHEFNNILQAIMMNASLLQMGIEPESPTWERVSTILERTKHGATLTEQLLDFSRRSEMRTRALNLNELVEETCHLLRRTLQYQVKVESDLAADLPNLVGDPDRIKQVTMNLALNARDAMPEGGVLSFRTAAVMVDEALAQQVPALKTGPYLLLSVSDTGEGIDPEIAQRIFDPFFTTKQVGKGTGLGLSIVHGIVESHGGAVRLESRLGQGSRFDIYLPVREQPAELAVSTPQAESEMTGGSETILVVDDEAEVLEAASQGLQHYGYRVVTARDGYEAMDFFTRDPQAVDAVILDMLMPGMSGREVLSQMLRLRPALPVLIASGCASLQRDRGSLGELADRYLSKPYSLRDLVEAVQHLLEEAKG
jgi:two-component system cell cycle sensor histidine kinase/response regulator CckA